MNVGAAKEVGWSHPLQRPAIIGDGGTETGLSVTETEARRLLVSESHRYPLLGGPPRCWGRWWREFRLRTILSAIPAYGWRGGEPWYPAERVCRGTGFLGKLGD